MLCIPFLYLALAAGQGFLLNTSSAVNIQHLPGDVIVFQVVIPAKAGIQSVILSAAKNLLSQPTDPSLSLRLRSGLKANSG